MTEQEKINVDVQTQLALQDAKFNAFMQEMRDFKTEMRDRDNQRAAEIMEIRQRQDAAQAKHDAEMHEMNQRFYAKFDSIDAKFAAMDAKIDSTMVSLNYLDRQLKNLAMIFRVGVGVIVVCELLIVVACVYLISTR